MRQEVRAPFQNCRHAPLYCKLQFLFAASDLSQLGPVSIQLLLNFIQSFPLGLEDLVVLEEGSLCRTKSCNRSREALFRILQLFCSILGEALKLLCLFSCLLASHSQILLAVVEGLFGQLSPECLESVSFLWANPHALSHKKPQQLPPTFRHIQELVHGLLHICHASFSGWFGSLQAVLLVRTTWKTPSAFSIQTMIHSS
mmetsp:Transcript_71270/g.144249  ORF Transcript_71270/g.144249 Transcript_71270/m.144249 type:complete len:200 (-) Transcript_71270:40-639(-)